ncbi:MAG: flagellar biosynthesis protein FlhF [Myxococcales bacterium]|nr:flagellar biosynthesis protein FlhF [Myxococcota bacterium]MDW8283354.1 flagellar biosynthesis protein FlhF [Myxococcales bacterium]
MKTVTFQARELKDALAQVRRTLGPDALIVSTRQISPMLGLGRPTLEVTAALPDGGASPRSESPAVATAARPEAMGRRPGTMARLLSRVSSGSSQSVRQEPNPPRQDTRPSTPARGVGPLRPPGLSEAEAREEAEAEAALEARLRPLQRELSTLRSQLYQVAQSTSPTLKQEVAELRALLRTMGIHAQRPGEITPEMAQLMNLGLERPRAEALLQRAREIGGEPRAALLRAISERVTTAGPVGVSARVAAFVGPTGVGKTTTIAKIAARAALVDGSKVALITVDTFRVGAVDQLQRYADLMELPLHVAGTSAALRSAVQANSSADLILVDTAGRGPRDAAQLASLRELLGGAEGIEVHLCLAATTRTREQQLALQSYRPLAPSRLCITKIDEAVQLGELLSLHETAQLPISYLGTGQRVPEDLELSTPERFAERVLAGLPREATAQGGCT